MFAAALHSPVSVNAVKVNQRSTHVIKHASDHMSLVELASLRLE